MSRYDIPPQQQARFWSRVIRSEGCWSFAGPLDTKGYHRFYSGAGQTLIAHRLAYHLSVKPVSHGTAIDHLCRNRACVNPAHLEETTLAENVMRGFGLPARNSRKQACDSGHPFEGRNLIVRRNGDRTCRACQNEARRRYLARKREAVAA